MKKIIILIFTILILSSFVLSDGTGGTITYDGGYTIHTFLTNGTFNTTDILNATYLIIAGGGAGGGSRYGGGGAGGLLYNSSYDLTGNRTIIVGYGGVGAVGIGMDGTNSAISSIIATGGGGGGSGVGRTGGSGSGSIDNLAAGTGTAGQGNNGGIGNGSGDLAAGGGGGAGWKGGNGTLTNAGDGGIGLNYSINGTNTYYAGGGGGGSYLTSISGAGGLGGGGAGGGGGGNNAGFSGRNGSGGGGGGGHYQTGANIGGYGGNGIVIIRYLSTNVTLRTNFISQSPADLNTTNIFSQRLNITYSHNTTFINDSFVNISIINSIANCNIFFNKTCVNYNNTPFYNYNVTGTQNRYYMFDDNEYIPASYKINETLFESSTLSFLTLSGLNEIAITKEYNLNNLTTYNFEEIGLNTSGTCNIYFANETGSSLATLLSSNKATIISQINKQNYSHCHSGGGTTHCDNVFGFQIINNKVNNITSINFNGTGYFIIKPNSALDNCYLQYSNTLYSNAGDSRTSNNALVTYTNQTYTFRSHLHQFGTSINTKISYQGCGNYSSVLDCSSFRIDYFDNALLPPSSVNYFNPYFEERINRTLNINCTDASSPQGSSITNYSFYLLNSDESVNVSLASNTTKCFTNIDTFSTLNLSVGQYKVLTIITDNNSLTSNTISSLFNITSNALLNITLVDALNNSIVIGNFSINFTDYSTGIIQQYTSSNNKTSINIIKYHNYSITFFALGYAISLYNYSANDSDYQTYYGTEFSSNSVAIYISDASSLGLITNITINVTLTSNTTQYLYNTTTGFLFVYNISAGYYEVKFNAPDYAENTYFLTISNSSTQTLNAYLTQTGTDVIFTFKDDSSGAVLEGVAVQVSRIINGSWIVIDTKFTDITGRTKFNLLFTTNYRFSNSFSGYDDKIFNLNPVLFTSYDVYMVKQSGVNQNEMDYSDISVQFLPTFFYSNATNNFTWEIRSPTGKLVSYNYNLTYPCGNQSFNGVSATGDLSLKTFDITCANASSTALLIYEYVTSTGDNRRYITSIGITYQTNNFTLMSNENNQYGMGTFERVLIVMIVVIALTGVASMLGGLTFGTLFGMLIMGFFMYQGFFPIWAGILPMIIGFFIIKESTGR